MNAQQIGEVVNYPKMGKIWYSFNAACFYPIAYLYASAGILYK
jgi:hypothetical protein